MLEVHLGVTLALIAASELASAEVAGERFLAGVRADVRGQVVAAAERAHADTALEGLVACVDAQVARKLVRAREAPVAVLGRARVGTLVHRRLARPVRVLSRADGFKGESLGLVVVVVVLGNVVLLRAQEARLQLLLVLKRPDGLERRDRWWVYTKGLHALERLVFHGARFTRATLVLEQVVVGDHGEEAGVYGFGGTVVLGGWVGQR